MKKLKIFVILGLASMICGLAGSSPLWMNQCSHQFSEAEITYLMQRYFTNLKDYEQMLIESGKYNEEERKEKVESHRQYLQIEEAQQRLEKAYIPCGTDDFSLEEKEAAANLRLGVLDELQDPPCVFFLPILRLDIEYARRADRNQEITHRNPVQTYHFVGYTLFYLPVLRAYHGSAGGGMGICPFSSECDVLP
ncbi:MAG TPA: hypothetical protein VFR47_09430 [Anaerolineales bacterium]|nr:hypothetical protein [Anaerolineales bacterium]